MIKHRQRTNEDLFIKLRASPFWCNNDEIVEGEEANCALNYSSQFSLTLKTLVGRD